MKSAMTMIFSLMISTLSLAGTAWSTRAHPYSPRSAGCAATSNYDAWASIKHAFIFGDSYSATGFNPTKVQPSIGNPLGNPRYPGFTYSNGPNWVDFLTVKYNEPTLLTYDFAYPGATVDSTIVHPASLTVLSVSQQVQEEFLPNYGTPSAAVSWTASNTIFGVFIGINDVGITYSRGNATTRVINGKVFAVYEKLMEMLYSTGARNFLFLKVPPVDQSPLTAERGISAQATEKDDIGRFNRRIDSLAAQLKSAHGDVNVFTYDTNALFTEVLADPSSFPQTSIYKNTTDYCPAYAGGTPNENYFNATCGIPVNQYFWLNSLHPTYPIHNVLAQQIAQTLEAGPNVC